MLALLLLLAVDSMPPPTMIAVAPAESLSVAEAGTGDPVVLIPDLFGSAYEYRRVVPLLVAAGHRAIVIEPLGVGHSGRPPEADYSLTAQATRIGVALDSLSVSSTTVVAHSVASSIVLRLALQRPHLIKAIVSLEGGVAEAATTPGFRRAMKFAPLLKLFGGVHTIRGMIARQFVNASGDPSWVTDRVVAEYTVGAARDLGATLNAYKAMGHSTEPDSLGPRLGAVRCPFLLLLGEAPHDGGPPASEVALLRRGLAAFAIDTIPGVGHFPQEEAPARVAAAVNRVDSAIALRGGGSRP